MVSNRVPTEKDLLCFFQLFNTELLDDFAKTTGFIRRRRKLSALEFLTLMTFGLTGMKFPSLAGMVGVLSARLTRVALHYRFNAKAVAFLTKCLQFTLRHKMTTVSIETSLLNSYHRVLIVDSSSWDVDPKLHPLLPGSGGEASKANCKIQIGYDYKSSELIFFEITPGTFPDNRYTNNLAKHISANDLLLLDLGYFKLSTLRSVHEKKAFFLSRFYIGTSLFTQQEHIPLNLEALLTQSNTDFFEIPIVIGKAELLIPCRLICQRVDEAIANQRRARIHKIAKKKGRTPSQLHLKLADWTLLLTNTSSSQLPANDAWLLYSLRWQIELFFKQIKSVLQIHHNNSSNIHRLLCEVMAKMIVVIFFMRIHGLLNNRFWNGKRKEISIEKLFKRLQERTLLIVNFILSSVGAALAYLACELQKIIRDLVKTSPPGRRTTLEKIDIA